MNPLVLVAALTVLFALWAFVARVQCRRLDQLEAANRRLQRRAEKAETRAHVAEANAEQWFNVAQERGAEAIEHGHRCLGELIHQDSGVLP